jgi:hypothetical protein
VRRNKRKPKEQVKNDQNKLDVEDWETFFVSKRTQ